MAICKACKKEFKPKRYWQKICSSEPCQIIRKRFSCKKWRNKPENKGYSTEYYRKKRLADLTQDALLTNYIYI